MAGGAGPGAAGDRPTSGGAGTSGRGTTGGGTSGGGTSGGGTTGGVGAAPRSDPGDFCPAGRTLVSTLSALDGNAGPSALRASVAPARAALGPALDAAPADIRADVGTVAAAYGGLFGALEQAGYDVSKVSLGAFQGISPSAVNAAAGRVEAYVAGSC